LKTAKNPTFSATGPLQTSFIPYEWIPFNKTIFLTRHACRVRRGRLVILPFTKYREESEPHA
jgi:hypothetical protein